MEPAGTTDPSALFLFDALSLVLELARIRDKRLDSAPSNVTEAAMADWQLRRDSLWSAAGEAVDQGHFIPLVAMGRQLGLSARELDIVALALAPRIDNEALDKMLGAQAGQLYRGVTDELALSLLFATPQARYEGRRLLSPLGKLIKQGLLELKPIGSDLAPDAYEIRVTQTFANFVLGQPIVSGPIGQYCDLDAPDHAWEAVMLPAELKDRVWTAVAGTPEVQARLDEWGYGTVMPRARGVVLLFAGPPGVGKSMLAHAVASRLGRQLLTVHTSRLVGSAESIRPILQEAFRIAALPGAVVLLDDCETLLEQRDARFLALLESLDRHHGIMILTTNDAPRIDMAMERRIQLRVDFEPPTPLLREHIWESHLPPEAPLGADIDIQTLSNAYEFTGAQIRNTVLIGLAQMVVAEAEGLDMALMRSAADTQLQARLGELAVKATIKGSLDRLVLPGEEHQKIAEVVDACQHREYVLSRWGFAESLSKGRGLCVLFDGPPGTGKTYGVELISQELKLPLYRIHIPNVVSKWVGETERNISKIFQRARSARAILLFDEADSLFGRRSGQSQSSNDRYANMEVNLLLQEIEAYDGITFLTTNLFGNLDDALQRRIQFRVTFPFPEPLERARIWRVLCPNAAPLDEDVDFKQLGKHFELAGGHIKNALLRAAYRARSDGGRIKQKHLADAALAECQAQGKIVRGLPTA